MPGVVSKLEKKHVCYTHRCIPRRLAQRIPELSTDSTTHFSAIVPKRISYSFPGILAAFTCYGSHSSASFGQPSPNMSAGPSGSSRRGPDPRDAPPGAFERQKKTWLVKGSWAIARAMVEAPDFPMLWRAEEHAKYRSQLAAYRSRSCRGGSATSDSRSPSIHYHWGNWKERLRDVREDWACLRAAQAELLRVFGERWPAYLANEPRTGNHLARAIIELELRRSDSYCQRRLFLDFSGSENPLGPSGLPDIPKAEYERQQMMRVRASTKDKIEDVTSIVEQLIRILRTKFERNQQERRRW